MFSIINKSLDDCDVLLTEMSLLLSVHISIATKKNSAFD